MSDSNQDQDRDPRFSRALLGRILAVCLFVALGTFAVIQMMNSGGKNKTDTTTAAEGDKPPTETESDTKTAAGPLPPLKSASIFDTSGDPPSAPPSRSAVSDTAFHSGSGQTNFNPPPSLNQSNFNPAKTFEPSQALPVATAKPSIQFPVDSPAQPPTRYAQLPASGVPVIGSDNGFGARPAPPASAPLNTPGSSGPPQPLLKTAIESAVDKSAGGVNQFSANVARSTNDLLTDAKQNANAAIEDFKNKLPNIEVNQNSFGAPANPAQAFKSSSSSPLEPVVKKTIDPPALRNGLPRDPGANPPSMVAPVPNQSGFANNSDLRPMNNGFGERPMAPANQPPEPPGGGPRVQSFPNPISEHALSPAPLEDRTRLNGINQSGSASNGISNSGFPTSDPPGRVVPRASFPAQPVSTPLNNASSRNVVANLPRTANVPGDRQLEGVQSPALTIEKLSPKEIQVNQSAEFEIVVRNVGRVTAEDVQVHDQIPAGTEFQGASPEPNDVTSDRRLNWEIGSLKSGQEKRIKFQLKPIQPGEIGSVAHVTFATQASMRTLVTKPVLEITHQTKPSVLVGGDVILDVVVSNKGDGAAKNVLIQEDVPKQLEYQGGYRELEYEIGTLLPGQSKRVQLGLKAAEIGRLKNLIFASAAGGLRTQHELEMEVIAPRLTTASDGPTRRFLQRQVAHQFKVGNQGTAPATNVDLIARLPAGLRFISADNQGKYSAGSHAVFWSIAELGMGVDAAVELVSMPVEVGSQNIKFEAVADLNQKSATEQELNVEHLIDVFFDIDDVVDPIEIGADTSYRIRVVNQGTQAATNVQLQIEFPNGLQPTGVEGSLQSQIQGQTIIFSPISSLKPGDQLDLLVRAKGQAAGDHRVVVNMQADGRQTPVSKEETTRVYADR